MPQAESAVCLHLCLSQSLFLSPGCFVFQGTPSWLKSGNVAVGLGISFHPHNCQQVRAQHLRRESWQARSQLWLTLENNNNIHLGVWNYLSRLVEVLPKAKKKKKRKHPMNNVLSSQPVTPMLRESRLTQRTRINSTPVVIMITLLFKDTDTDKDQKNCSTR